jgi:hypothetical protein
MNGIVLLVAVLICPLVMGTAMLLMWREMRRGHSPEPAADSPSESQPEMDSKRDQAHARRA